MSNLQFQKATKKQAKLRLAIFGPSGAGKTYSALRIATGMGGRVAVIDTEHGSASKYGDRFDFDVLNLPGQDIRTYIKAMAAATEYDVLIIDSLTHAWKELLQEVDKLAYSKFGGNTWAAWSKGTPKQNMMVDALLRFPGHIIATMRSKTEWTVQDKDGQKTPVRVGLSPDQGKGIEYEFDMLMQLSPNHVAEVLKDRTGRYQDDFIELPDEEFGQALADWLNEGEAPSEPETPEPDDDGEPEGAQDGSDGAQDDSSDTSQVADASDDSDAESDARAVERPYDLATLRAGFEKRIAKREGAGLIVPKAEQGRIMGGVEYCFRGTDVDPEKGRRSFLAAIFGEDKTESAKLSGAEFATLDEYLKYAPLDEDELGPDDVKWQCPLIVVQEVQGAVREHLKESGQTEMDLAA